MDDLVRWWPLALFLLNGVSFWLVWSIRTGLVSKSELDLTRREIDGRIDNVDRRVATVESELRHLPTQRDITLLTGQIGQLESRMGEALGRLEGIGRATDLMNEHLLIHRKKD